MKNVNQNDGHSLKQAYDLLGAVLDAENGHPVRLRSDENGEIEDQDLQIDMKNGSF